MRKLGEDFFRCNLELLRSSEFKSLNFRNELMVDKNDKNCFKRETLCYRKNEMYFLRYHKNERCISTRKRGSNYASLISRVKYFPRHVDKQKVQDREKQGGKSEFRGCHISYRG